MKFIHHFWQLAICLLLTSCEILVEEDILKNVRHTGAGFLENENQGTLFSEPNHKRSFKAWKKNSESKIVARNLRDDGFSMPKSAVKKSLKTLYSLFVKKKPAQARKLKLRKKPVEKKLIQQVGRYLKNFFKKRRGFNRRRPTSGQRNRSRSRSGNRKLSNSQSRGRLWSSNKRETISKNRLRLSSTNSKGSHPSHTLSIKASHPQKSQTSFRKTSAASPDEEVPKRELSAAQGGGLENYTQIRHDVTRFRNQIRHIQLINADQSLVEALWRHLQVGLARFRNKNRHARRYNGVILRTNLANRLRNERNQIRKSALRMEDVIYQENGNLFRRIRRQAILFENSAITNTTIFYDTAQNRFSDFVDPNPLDIFY